MPYSIAPYPPSPAIQVNGTPEYVSAINFGSGLAATVANGILTLSTAPSANVITFHGRSGAGPITVTGLQVGDVIGWKDGSAINVAGSPTPTGAGVFENACSVAGQLQQVSTSDLSSGIYLAVASRA